MVLLNERPQTKLNIFIIWDNNKLKKKLITELKVSMKIVKLFWGKTLTYTLY